VSAATRELADGTRAIDLPARAFDCLVYLIEHRDRAVGRDELIAAVWGRADVSEALLSHTILNIRRALGGGGQ
jgi:DNA-binding winged helix-turn-helix (wHTH) protein